jgi:hypothetical protein
MDVWCHEQVECIYRIPLGLPDNTIDRKARDCERSDNRLFPLLSASKGFLISKEDPCRLVRSAPLLLSLLVQSVALPLSRRPSFVTTHLSRSHPLACLLRRLSITRRRIRLFESRQQRPCSYIISLSLSLNVRLAIPNRYNLALLRDNLALTIRPVSRWKTNVQAGLRRDLDLFSIQ